MKVGDLEGELLDYWAARAGGGGDVALVRMETLGETWGQLWQHPNLGFRPSSNWAHGGPIIEREQMTIWHRMEDASGNDWNACIGLRNGYEVTESGPTLLIAAMRAFVASKFGASVPDL